MLLKLDTRGYLAFFDILSAKYPRYCSKSIGITYKLNNTPKSYAYIVYCPNIDCLMYCFINDK